MVGLENSRNLEEEGDGKGDRGNYVIRLRVLQTWSLSIEIVCDSDIVRGFRCLRQRNLIAAWCIDDMETDRGISGHHIR